MNNTTSQGILKKGIVPLSMIHEVRHRGSVMLTGHGKISCFAAVPPEKNRNKDSHQMFQIDIGQKATEIKGFKVIVNFIRMMYNVCNRHLLVCVSRLMVALQLYIIQQRVSLFCAKFRIYSFIVLLLVF